MNQYGSVINGVRLLQCAPIKDMVRYKASYGGATHGLGEAGYDIRLNQTIVFGKKRKWFFFEKRFVNVGTYNQDLWGDTALNWETHPGRFALASTIEKFTMPTNIVGVVHDKSTWARRGLSVQNTVIEPGWSGYLTLELHYQGEDELILPIGAGIAQVLFHQTWEPAKYSGRYQDQENRPVPAISAG